MRTMRPLMFLLSICLLSCGADPLVESAEEVDAPELRLHLDSVRSPQSTCIRSSDCQSCEQCKMNFCETITTLGIVCRPKASLCDKAPEYCDGVSPTCPLDDVELADTPCRSASGICDLDDVCDGIHGFCPDKVKDTTVICRYAGTNPCLIDSYCDGLRHACNLKYQPAGFPCGGGKTCNGFGSCR